MHPPGIEPGPSGLQPDALPFKLRTHARFRSSGYLLAAGRHRSSLDSLPGHTTEPRSPFPCHGGHGRGRRAETKNRTPVNCLQDSRSTTELYRHVPHFRVTGVRQPVMRIPFERILTPTPCPSTNRYIGGSCATRCDPQDVASCCEYLAGDCNPVIEVWITHPEGWSDSDGIRTRDFHLDRVARTAKLLYGIKDQPPRSFPETHARLRRRMGLYPHRGWLRLVHRALTTGQSMYSRIIPTGHSSPSRNAAGSYLPSGCQRIRYIPEM